MFPVQNKCLKHGVGQFYCITPMKLSTAKLNFSAYLR